METGCWGFRGFDTWMHGLYVPGEHTIHTSIDNEHHHRKTKVKVISFYWWLADGPPLDANACYLIQCKILRTQAKGCGGHQRLKERDEARIYSQHLDYWIVIYQGIKRQRSFFYKKIPNVVRRFKWKGVKKQKSPYSDALLKGSDLIMGHLLPDGHIHVGYVAEEVDDSSTGWSQLGFRVDNGHQETGKQIKCYISFCIIY